MAFRIDFDLDFKTRALHTRGQLFRGFTVDFGLFGAFFFQAGLQTESLLLSDHGFLPRQKEITGIPGLDSHDIAAAADCIDVF